MGSYKYTKTKRLRGKVKSSLDIKLDKVKWGEFRLNELFTIKRGKRLIVSNRIKGNRPLVTAGYENAGVSGFIGNENQEIFSKDTITIDMFANSFYRSYEYSADDNILILFNIGEISSKAKIFIVNTINKSLKNKYSYGKQYRIESFNQTKIKLPIKEDGNIDFDFMDSFIAELEAYLIATGLQDTAVTQKEQKALDEFDDFIWGGVKLIDVFTINSYKKRFDANKVTILENGSPYIVRTSLNNGVRGYINENKEFLNDENTISFGQDTATMFYQEKPYFTGDKIKILKAKNEKFCKENAQFFITTMRKSFNTFSWGSSSFNVNIIKNQLIELPIKDNQIDYDYMQTLISAIQKLVIKDVVAFADEKIKATKSIVSRDI